MQRVYKKLDKQYKQISLDIENQTNQDKINSMKKIYRAKSDQELLMAIKPHPLSVTLAQAAMESSWGTSRFFKEANNLFGVWSFNKKEPRIAAGDQRGDKTIWLKKYASVEDSVADYYKNLGRNSAYREFRDEKMLSNNPYILVTKLNRYSEKGAKYGKELTSMMSFNNFLQYDNQFFDKPTMTLPKTVKKEKAQLILDNSQKSEIKEVVIEDTNRSESVLPNEKDFEIADTNSTIKISTETIQPTQFDTTLSLPPIKEEKVQVGLETSSEDESKEIMSEDTHQTQTIIPNKKDEQITDINSTIEISTEAIQTIQTSKEDSNNTM